MEKLLTTKQAAEFLAISPRKLWELTNRRLIVSVRIDRCVRYDPKDLRSWISRNKTRPFTRPEHRRVHY